MHEEFADTLSTTKGALKKTGRIDTIGLYGSHARGSWVDNPRLPGAIAPTVPVEPPKPAVSVRASVKPDRLICLEDGTAVKLLKPHLRSEHGMTPDELSRQVKPSEELPDDRSRLLEYAQRDRQGD